MKPIRLTMQAFGPYAGREIVDFRSAVDAGLFGIYGQTGSGKSTIFSAMTFALFGQAAKAEQEAPTLRCDIADGDLPTEVEFVFDLADKRYVVRRRPEQRRPKQRGTGETRDAHEAWLFDATGLALDAITPDHPGKVIEEKKVASVGKAIEDLLGYGSQQFRQIVLLPQGRFEAFLAADTKTRLSILRDLFDVSLYRDLAATLKNDAEASERQVREERAIFTRRLSLEGFESLDALTGGIANLDAELLALQTREDDERTRLKQHQTSLEGARLVEGLFQTAERATKEVEALGSRSAEIDELEVRFRSAEKVASLRGFRDHVVEAEDALTGADAVHAKAKDAAASAAKEAEAASATHQIEEARSHELVAMTRDVNTLEHHQVTFEKSNEESEALQTAENELVVAKRVLRASSDRLDELRQSRQAESDALKIAQQTELRRSELDRQLATVNGDLKLAEHVERAESDVASSRLRIDDLAAAYRQEQIASTQTQLGFDEAERRLSDVQALHLAQKLEPGAPCPVCGATDHPDPATGGVDHAGLDIAFREARKELEKSQKAEHQAHTELVSAQGILAERELRLASLERPEKSLPELRDEAAMTKAALDALGPTIDIRIAEARLEKLGEYLAAEEAAREESRATVQRAEAAVAGAGAVLRAMLAEIPEALRDRVKLEDALGSTRRALEQRENARRAAGEAAVETSERALGARKDLEAAEAVLKDRQQRLAKARDDFLSRLLQANLTEGAFQELKGAVESIDQDREAVELFRREMHAANDAVRKADEALSGRERPDLVPLEDDVREAEQALQQAQDLRADAAARLGQVNKLLAELSETIERLDRAEAESGPLRELAALMDAKNALNLDLETFAIGAMFDKVLDAANQRFGPMSNGRYSLERATEGTGRGRRGLGIQVHDVHTGKARPTTTLSGGESFIAALALALGLSDVVESLNGKVRLDTIFIDEGFGSLDTENGAGTLDQVLQALGSLVSQNRSVGLISHVPLVQEAIPNGFYIRKDLSGSRVEQRGVF